MLWCYLIYSKNRQLQRSTCFGLMKLFGKLHGKEIEFWSSREGTMWVLFKNSSFNSFVLNVSAEAYDPLDPTGNITIKWDIMSWTPDGYVVSDMKCRVGVLVLVVSSIYASAPRDHIQFLGSLFSITSRHFISLLEFSNNILVCNWYQLVRVCG